jgi:phosphatidate cytidylyltransferase
VPNLAKRLLTAAVAVPILLGLVYLAPPIAFTLLVCAAAGAAAFEYTSIVDPSSLRLRVLCPVGSAGLVAGLTLAGQDPRAWATAAAGLPLVALQASLVRPGADRAAAHRRSAALGLGLAYTGLLPVFVALLHRTPERGPDLVILLLTIAFLGDTGAYVTGRAVGRHPLYPAVSPKKTKEGAVGGLLASAGAAALAHYWYLPELPLGPGLALAVVAGASGQAGDLCESLLKRAHGVKDSGRLLPGHGGMLDRIDALLFAAPVLYLGLLWIGLVDLE